MPVGLEWPADLGPSKDQAIQKGSSSLGESCERSRAILIGTCCERSEAVPEPP